MPGACHKNKKGHGFSPMAFRKFLFCVLFPKNDGRGAHAQKKSQAQKAQQKIQNDQLSSCFTRHSQESLEKCTTYKIEELYCQYLFF
jgi:hypothetical protein